VDLWEGTKYAAAILGSLLLVAVCHWFGASIYPAEYLARSAYKVPGAADPPVDLAALRRSWPQSLESPGDRLKLISYMRDMKQEAADNLVSESGATAAPAVEQMPDFATAIPAASSSDGEQVAQRCQQCHDWSKGGPNKIGPNLYGIIGRPRASRPGFSYSSAMTSKGGTWTYDEIFRFLHSPAGYIPGTKMSFIGLPRAKDRLNVIAYMRSWADSPPALPPPGPAQPATAQGAKPPSTPAPPKKAQ
jgi:cytochrome c